MRSWSRLHRSFRRVAILVSSVVLLLSGTARATEYPALHLYQSIQYSDLVMIGIVLNAERAVVRVDRVLKGRATGSIQLVNFVGPFMAAADRKPLVTGAQELMFLKRQGEFYEPLQTQFGRWTIRSGRVDAPRHVATLGLEDYRTTIGTLVRIQAAADAGGAEATEAFLEGLRSNDPHVRLWAAHAASEKIAAPPASLVDAYLRLWSTRDGEMMGSVANAVIKWRVARAAPMIAATLRDGSESERTTAARALGGTGDRAFESQLRTVALSDNSPRVRAFAFEGLTHLLGRDSIADLLKGANDADARVRQQALSLLRKLDVR